MSAPPMYEATALIPIRASVLRSPASNAEASPATASDRAQRLGAARAGQLGGELDGEPRLDRGRTDGEDHGHRVDVEDVDGADRQVGPSAQARLGQRGVDGARREDRRDRQALDRPGGIGQDEELGAAARRGDGLGGEAIQRRGQAVRARLRIPGRIERAHGRRAAAGSHRVEQPVEVDHDRPGQADRPRAARRTAEEGRSPAELDPEVHHDPFAFRVDGRVRDLGERLAEMVGDRPVEPTATRRRRVVAHAPQRLVALERHRLDVEPGALGVETGEIAQDVVGGGAGRSTARPRRDPPRSVARRHGSAGREAPTSSPRRPP